MEVTILKVAERAKVSVSTASRVLNGGTKGMRKDAARRASMVLKAAKELGYSPNPAARSLVTRRSSTIGLITTELNNPVRSKFIEELRVTALESGFKLLVSGMRGNDDILPILNSTVAQRVDGLILGNIPPGAVVRINELCKKGLPVVSFGQAANVGWDHFNIDYRNMVEKLTRHMITVHGARKNVFIGLDVACARIEGYKSAMKEAGLQDNIELWMTSEYDLAAGQKIVNKYIHGDNLPEAIICHNDLLAIGVIAGLRKKGLRVPGNIAVVGLDNIDMAEYVNPTLTTAGVDPTDLAMQVFKMLYERIGSEYAGEPGKILCENKLFFRESCGCDCH